MIRLNQKDCVLSCLVILLINLIEGKHLLHSGIATGRMVNMQDSVIESCRGHFMCKVFPIHNSLGLTCLHARYVCDGVRHCEQGEDEIPSECGGKGGHGGGGIVVYDSHAGNHGHGQELHLDGGGEYSHSHDGHHEEHTGEHHGNHGGKKSGSKGRSNRQVIIVQQPPAPAPSPKKHRTILAPQAVPVPMLPQPRMLPPPIGPPLLPPRILSPYARLGRFGYGGLGGLGLGGLGGIGGIGGIGGMGGLEALALREALD